MPNNIVPRHMHQQPTKQSSRHKCAPLTDQSDLACSKSSLSRRSALCTADRLSLRHHASCPRRECVGIPAVRTFVQHHHCNKDIISRHLQRESTLAANFAVPKCSLLGSMSNRPFPAPLTIHRRRSALSDQADMRYAVAARSNYATIHATKQLDSRSIDESLKVLDVSGRREEAEQAITRWQSGWPKAKYIHARLEPVSQTAVFWYLSTSTSFSRILDDKAFGNHQEWRAERWTIMQQNTDGQAQDHRSSSREQH